VVTKLNRGGGRKGQLCQKKFYCSPRNGIRLDAEREGKEGSAGRSFDSPSGATEGNDCISKGRDIRRKNIS